MLAPVTRLAGRRRTAAATPSRCHVVCTWHCLLAPPCFVVKGVCPHEVREFQLRVDETNKPKLLFVLCC